MRSRFELFLLSSQIATTSISLVSNYEFQILVNIDHGTDRLSRSNLMCLMIAALTRIPVIGVPIESKKLKGLDSLLSIAQMPKGIPVGTVAIGVDGAINAALCAVQILGTSDEKIAGMLMEYKSKMHDDVLAANESIQ